LLVMHENKSKVVTYDTMDDDDAKFGVGLGGNGIIQVLIEPIDPATPFNPIVLLMAADEKRQQSVLVGSSNLIARMGPQPGSCLLVREDEMLMENAWEMKDQLIQDAKQCLLTQQSSFKNYVSDKTDLIAFIEVIKPPVSLVIAGAGNDVIPVVEIAKILGWETLIVDGRSNYATQGRFGSGCQVLVSK